MVQEVSTPRATEAGPPASEVAEESPAGPPASAGGTGRVPLDRLLTMATLSPAEATFVACHLLESTDLPRPVDGALPHDDRWVVAITASGDVEATPTGPRSGAAVAELLGQLVRSARRLPAHPAAGQLVLLRRLEEAAAETGAEPGTQAGTLRRALVETLGADGSERLRAQLAHLVDAYVHVAASTATQPGVLTGAGVAQPGPGSPGPRRPAPERSSRRRPRSGGPALGHRRAPARRVVLAALLLVVAVAGSGYVLTRRADDASAGSPGPSTAAPSGKASAGTPSKSAEQGSSRPRARVETLAPRRAGVVTGVELRRAGACTPGALCAVTVTTRFRPAPSAQAVTWRVGTVTSCNGRVSWSPPVSVTAQPGWTSVYASSSVPVPRGRSVALVATTTAPARAQSPPVPATGSSLRC